MDVKRSIVFLVRFNDLVISMKILFYGDSTYIQ